MNIIDVNANNVEAMGFFCYMSKRTEAGFQRKMNWIQKRFAEGMKLKMLELPDRGFIEYIPGEYCWRAVDVKGYMFIHCLWVVGKSRGKGYAKALLAGRRETRSAMPISSGPSPKRHHSSSKAMSPGKNTSTGSPTSTAKAKPCPSWHTNWAGPFISC